MLSDSPFKKRCKPAFQMQVWWLLTNSTQYEEHQAYFTNFRPVVANACGPLLPVTPSSLYAVMAPKPPVCPKTFVDLKNDPYKEYWYSTIMERYTKNHQVGLFSASLPHENIRKPATVLQTVSTSCILLFAMHNGCPGSSIGYDHLCPRR